jgi:hypothetical protein
MRPLQTGTVVQAGTWQERPIVNLCGRKRAPAGVYKECTARANLVPWSVMERPQAAPPRCLQAYAVAVTEGAGRMHQPADRELLPIPP